METDLDKMRREKFKEALTRTYSGCLFDIDGTLTVQGEEYIPAFAHEPLAKLAMSVPVAVCTARSLNHALEGLMPIFTRATDPKYCQANWLVICENGGIGYFFDSEKNTYTEFFRVPYPYTDEIKEKIFNRIKSDLAGKTGQVKMNEISLAFKPLNYSAGTPAEVAASCHEIAGIISESLKMVDPKNVLRVGDSGSGVNVYPYSGDKENGTIRFAEYLRKVKGMNVGEFAKELVVVGDQPQPEGNDFIFLNGKYGTPFTVGNLHPENIDPLPVYDASGNIVKGPEATITLINQLQFRS